MRYEGPSIHNDHRVFLAISTLSVTINIARIEYVTWLLTLNATYNFRRLLARRASLDFLVAKMMVIIF